MTEERLDEIAALLEEGAVGWQGAWYNSEGWLAEMEAFVSESLKALPELIAEVQRLQRENAQLRKIRDGLTDIAGAALNRRGMW